MTRYPRAFVAGVSCSVLLFAACSGEAPSESAAPEVVTEAPGHAGPLVVRASRPPQIMIPVLDAWRAETGGQFELVNAEEGDAYAQADLVILHSLADSWDMAEADELRPIYSETAQQNIDPRLRDAESRWYGLSKRGRVVVYDPSTVAAEELATLVDYASLRDERWRERLCLSSSSIGGNRLLVASLISRNDLREAELIVRAWRANLAGPVLPDDEALLEAIADGACQIGIADSHDAAATDGVSIHWFDDPATILVDVTTAGVSRHAIDPDRATGLLEWLTTETPNALFAIQDLELPANPASPAGNIVSGYTVHLSKPASLSDLGFLIEEADLLVERARYP
jgi:iron(III) transport system substrate-binding protein